MFGITPGLMNQIFVKAKDFELTNTAVHVFWLFAFLKCYLPIDCLHTIFNVSYTTFNETIWHFLDGFGEYWSTIDFQNRKNWPGRMFRDHYVTCIVDTTECYIQRPGDQDVQQDYYSGYKKSHTLKYSVIISLTNRCIVNIDVINLIVHQLGTVCWTS